MVRLLHQLNAQPPMVTTLLGMVMLVNPRITVPGIE